MASRTKQKEEARARRLAEEQARTERARRTRRIQLLGGVVLIAVAVVAVAIAVSSGGGSKPTVAKPHSKAANGVVTRVDKLLAGIPQSGNTLGSPKAKVTVTEFGDLECSVCDAFALSPTQHTSAGTLGSGIEDQLIAKDVRSGKVKLVFRSLETASGSNPDQSAFLNQQTAAYAAGMQNKAWNFIELFYAQQQPEGTAYVTPKFLGGLAQEIPGLNYSDWLSHSHDPSLEAQVQRDEQFASAKGFTATPTLTIVGPKGEAVPIQTLPNNYSQVESEINQVL